MVALSFCGTVSAGVKVAFTGDQGHDDNARAVLNMIANEGTDLLLIQGDLGYDPGVYDIWESNLTNSLGGNFPVLSVVGNHEDHDWSDYHRLIKDRVNRAGELSCSGNPGVKAHCTFKNIEIVQASPGINEAEGVDPNDDYAGYIADKFSGSSGKWRICSWHKNQKNLQTGEKSNSTGWDEYHACMNAGAFVAVAHEHAYSRTHLLSNFESQSVVHRNSDMTIEPGKSFMFVSGLGGRSVRSQTRGGDWWASIYTASQGATHGALFCDFESQTAACYFKAIDGSIRDEFTLRLKSDGSGSSIDVNAIVAAEQNSNSNTNVSLPAVFERTDVDEFRWIDTNENGDVGNIWISRDCANTLGGTEYSGDWDNLIAIAPAIDSIASPCGANGQSNQSQADQTQIPQGGFVFARTDKDELRWIDQTPRGALGSVRIDQACSDQFGGPAVSGDWFKLMDIAPQMDAIADPCGDARRAEFGNVSGSSVSAAPPQQTTGFVFQRTDKDEMRWVAPTASGEIGSVRINKICARNIGGQRRSGDWQALVELAPKVDQVAHPCNIEDQPVDVSTNASATVGYVFKRNDISNEYRWIAMSSNGQMGSVWIEKDCAKNFGEPAVYGNWKELMQIAPAFDSIKSPCN